MMDDLEILGERIATLSAQIQAATYQLLVMIREFDAREGWGRGFRSCAHWLNWRTGLDFGAAREKVRVARALATLPAIAGAMHRGELSFSKVRALTRVATPATEKELMIFAKAGTAAHVEKLVRSWRRVDRLAEMEQEQRQFASRYLRMHTDEDGMVIVQARLPPEVGAAFTKALAAAGDRLRDTTDATDSNEVSAEQQRADAVGLVAESALAAGLDPGTRGDRYQVVLHVDAEALARDAREGTLSFESGGHVSAETSRRLACDAALVVMRHDADGRTLDVGRRKRTVSPALRRALGHRDRGCRFPGCGLRLCDAHHVEHWADGGATRLDNLVLLCRRHHRAVHEEGFRVELLDFGEVMFRRPDGRPLPAAPALPPMRPEGAAGPALPFAELGVELDPAAGLPSWNGDRVDIGWAVEYLHARTAELV
ncbi:MAG TPA: DUF222 domain-containing protein [Thermoanaerobaculia bacterium]|jgi:hypothetical protein|nr:DUF222 domain-containing protein [Thermoanaerobaculia bacterium]